MVELIDGQLVINGQPRLLVSGEIHYFRLDRADWEDRIIKLKAVGGNAVASYIPWLYHELPDGSIDLTGQTRPNRDLGAFIDLCRDHDLLFFARPGPFVMAELKNEGLPFRLYKEHPEIIPVSWDGKPVPTRTVDYLAPTFLNEARRWYAAVGEILAPRLMQNGGNVFAMQLDNEVGMLSWVTNSPDLTDGVIADFGDWLQRRYPANDVAARYPDTLLDPQSRVDAVRSPAEEYAPHLMHDLGLYMRDRFARYIAALRGYAEEAGITGIPFVVNIHGTADGSGAPFAVGISQLYESYTQAPGYLAGSDHYLGDLSFAKAVDLYLINGFMAAVNRPEQPLASVEFESGEGDYGSSLDVRLDPSSEDFKIRLSLAQGNRWLNFYLFSGGINARLDQPVGDGNDRIGFTGERHGFNAPVGPEGALSATYPQLARTVPAMMAVADKLAVAQEERDGITLGFIPDYYLTESIYPESEAMRQIADNLTRMRGAGPRGALARALLASCFRFGCLDIQDRPLDQATIPVLALASARNMSAAIQTKLVDYLNTGGHLLLVGEVPLEEMDGASCTVLVDALGLTHAGERWASAHYHLSLVAEGWAAPRAEFRIGWAQLFAPTVSGVLLRTYDSDYACGFDITVGTGRAIVFTADLPCDLDLFRAAFARLGANPALRHGYSRGGIILTSTATPSGERFIHLLNLDGFDKPVRLTENDRELLPGQTLLLRRRGALMLPFGVTIGDVTIVDSTAEIARVEEETIRFRVTQACETITLRTARSITADDGVEVVQHENRWLITARQSARRGGPDGEYVTMHIS